MMDRQSGAHCSLSYMTPRSRGAFPRRNGSHRARVTNGQETRGDIGALIGVTVGVLAIASSGRSSLHTGRDLRGRRRRRPVELVQPPPAGYPEKLDATVVVILSAAGKFRPTSAVYADVFPGIA